MLCCILIVHFVSLGLFIALGLTGVVPGLHYIFTAGVAEAFWIYFWLLFMAFLYILGGVIYAIRIPERLYPGKFDIWVRCFSVSEYYRFSNKNCAYIGYL